MPKGAEGSQREPNESQKGAKEEPKEAKQSPKGDKREPKGSQKGSQKGTLGASWADPGGATRQKVNRLNLFWPILGSILDHFGTMLGPCWAFVASCSGLLWCVVSRCVAKSAALKNV